SAERALARVLEGRTVISIAHRLYSAHAADRVAVMIDGRVAELGSHDELVERGGEYARLWEMWQAVDAPEV
ncbi:ABC transporter ATP-binding protein, partial [Actinotignum timonense]|nr:ABC transporter ATP-binding protein [Actinotignum timonense]